MNFKTIFCLLMMLSLSAVAQAEPATKQALDIIADFADRLCQTVPLETASTSVELSGSAKADLAGLIKKIADLGIEGAGKYSSQSSQNVLQRNLAETLKETRNCRLQIWNDMKTSFQLAQPSTPKACRDKTHGVEKYAREFDVTRTSQWMGGGYSQDPWCTDVMNQLRTELPDGSFNKISSSERSETKCAPFNCPQYQYTCTVHVKADPIYFEKVSSACK